MYFRHYFSLLNCPHLSLTVAVILCLFGVTKLNKISSACGTRKWSARSVCCVCKEDTPYDSLHFWDARKTNISSLFICCSMKHYFFFWRFIWSMSQNHFFFLMYTHIWLHHGHYNEGDIYENKAVEYDVSFMSAYCACGWSEGSLCRSKYLSVLKCWYMFIHFKSNTKSERLLLVFPCTLMVQILMTNKSYFLFILAVL